MALDTIKEAKKIAGHMLQTPFRNIWSSYDQKADVLYISFKKPACADDSEMTDDDIIIRYEKGKIIGITILNASKMVKKLT